MAATTKVKLYYLGHPYKVDRKLYVNSYQVSFAVPEVGGYLEIEKYHADHIMQSFNVYQSAVWSLDKRMAEAAKAKRENPQLATMTATSYTREQLLEMLKAIEKPKEDPLGVDPMIEQLKQSDTAVVNNDKGDVKSSSKGK